MSVSLNPGSALGFNRPLTQLVKRTLTITNSNVQPVAFKVKTTAPKLYCVRPNSGRVEPGESVEVSVMLQAMKEEPPLAAKCKDKFLIQSTVITAEKETMPLNEIWNVTEGGEEMKVHQQKLKVLYLPPEGQTVEEEDETPANQSLLQEQPEYSQSLSRFPQGNGHLIQHSQDSTILPPPQPEELERPATPAANFMVAREESHEEPTEPAVGVVNVNVHTPPPQPPAIPAPPPRNEVNEELLAKYSAAKSEIERLRALLAAVPEPSTIPESTTNVTELRRRTRGLSDDGRSTVAESDVGTYVEEVYHQEGVPLQVVVIIALGVFVTTYLFF